MMPGGRMNPKQMKAMMRRMGITKEDIEDVEEVVIKTRSKEIVFKMSSAAPGLTFCTRLTVQPPKPAPVMREP